MRFTSVVLVGLLLAPSAVFAQVQDTPISHDGTSVVQPQSSRNRTSGTGTAWTRLPTQEQQPQESPADRQVPQVQMPGAQDVPAPPSVNGQQQIGPALQVQSNAATMPDECYERRGCGNCNLGEPIKVFGQTPHGLEVGGWFQSGYNSDSDGLWNINDDQWNLNQAWIYAERKAPRCCGLSFGYRFDAVYGVDAQNMQAIGNPPAGAPEGWDNEWDHGIYGWALPQAYGEIAYNNWSMIAGHYLCPLGYEQSMSPKNFFYSHSYAFTRIVPQTLTGTLSNWHLSDDTTIYTGVTTNWDTGFNRFNDSLNYLGGFAYKPCAPVQLTSIACVGDTGYREDGWTQDTFVDVMVTDKLNYIGEWSFENSDTAHQFSLANYLIYKVNDCVGLGSRFEWYKSDTYTDTADSTYSWSSGINFRRHANVVVRPELRVDWGEGAVDPGQPIFASDMIITF